MRSLSEEIGALGPAAEAVRGYLRGYGVTDGDLDDVVKAGTAAQALEDEQARFGFDDVLAEFLGVWERVLPHEAGLDYVADARRWGLLQMRIRRRFRDGPGGTFSLRQVGRKVRAMIADHLEGPEIDEVIPPVSLTAAAFDDKVRALPPREAAAEMGHALRFHLEERVRTEDPEKYDRLSKRLEEILRELPGRFEEQIDQLGELIEKAQQETAEEEDPVLAGLSPLEQQVYRRLDQLLQESPGVRRVELDPGEIAGAVCDAAAKTMAKAAYQGQSQDLSELANGIQMQLIRAGLQPVGEWAPLADIAEDLAAFAASNRSRFLARLRGE
jgi:type I restriction enzyme R subunit